MTSSMRAKGSSSPRVCAPLTPSLCVGRSCRSAQETCVRSGGQSPELRDRHACLGGVACFRGCSRSSFLREGPALPRGDGRWLEHLPNRLRAGSRASRCLTSLDAPGCCCLLWVAGREPGGGSQVWMRWVGWGEPSSCLLCTVVAASASAETWGGLGVPFSLWLAGRVGRGAVVPPLLSLASDLCFTLSLGDAICFAAAVQCAAHCCGAPLWRQTMGAPLPAPRWVRHGCQASGEPAGCGPAPAAAPGRKPQPGCPVRGELEAALGAAPHPSASAPPAAQNKEAGGRAWGFLVTQWGVCDGQGGRAVAARPLFVSLCGNFYGSRFTLRVPLVPLYQR